MAKKEIRPEICVLECKGCKRCVLACPKKLISLSAETNERGYHYAVYVGEGCTGCASCYLTCPEPNAIKVIIPKKEAD